MASLASNLQIEIKGECYALDKVPGRNSAVVLEEKEKLLRVIDLKALVDDLGRVGRFIRIAYNGVGAAGPKYTENQIEIQQLGYDITKLCDKSAITVAKFKKASSSVITDLQITYEYLLENQEDLAIETLSSVSKLAGDMQKAALELQHQFEAEAEKVKHTTESTQRATQDAAFQAAKQKKKLAELEAKQQEECQLMKEHQEKEREAEVRRRELEMQEDRAISEIGDINPLKEITNFVTSTIRGRNTFSTDGAERKAEALHKAQQEALQIEQAIQDKRHEALARMTAFTMKIKQSSEELSMAECAVDALHEAAGALKHLSAIMMQAAIFWEQLQDHCQALAEYKIKSQVEKARKEKSKEERLKQWTSKGFKLQAIRFCAGWVALHDVCSTYMEQIKLTQKDLYRYVTENPTWEQSRKNLKDLADNFFVDLQRDQRMLHERDSSKRHEKALSEKDFKIQEETVSLKRGDQ